jgi:hypothetical protein
MLAESDVQLPVTFHNYIADLLLQARNSVGPQQILASESMFQHSIDTPAYLAGMWVS